MEAQRWPAGISLGVDAATLWELTVTAGKQSAALLSDAMSALARERDLSKS